MDAPADGRPTSLRELALLFAKLGALGFGGPAAHLALMHAEVVTRRAWLTEEGFLDLVGATNLIPGPNSTELAIHIGWARRRLPGLLVAGAAFILPATLITAALAWAYARYAALPELAWLLYGVKPVMLAVVAHALWSLAPKAARTTPLRVTGLAAFAAVLLGANELAVLFGGGLLVLLGRGLGPGRQHGVRMLPWILGARAASHPTTDGSLSATGAAGTLGGVAAALGGAASAVPLLPLFGVFLKTGAVLYGSGYVLLAFLRADLVERLGWLSEAQLLDAIAVGQVTPGPVFTTATFIGYVLAGPGGAIVATVGIFLPAFVFVLASGPLVPRLRASRHAGAFLDGVNVASLALMLAVTIELGGAALVDLPTVAVAVVALALLVGPKPNATWLVLGGAAVGLAAHALGLARV